MLDKKYERYVFALIMGTIMSFIMSFIISFINLGYANPLKLGDFGYEGACVPDPYYFRDFEEFKNVYSMIETCVISLIENYIKDIK